MTLPEKMDRLVYATRIDRLIFRKLKPRSLRWIPVVVLAALIAGYALTASSVTKADYLAGSLLFYAAFIAANFVRIFGPRFAATARDPLDERELAIKARAHAVSGAVIAGLVVSGCFYMSVAGTLGLWRPDTPFDWINLGFGVQAISMLLPTWFASWMEPRPTADRED